MEKVAKHRILVIKKSGGLVLRGKVAIGKGHSELQMGKKRSGVSTKVGKPRGDARDGGRQQGGGWRIG